MARYSKHSMASAAAIAIALVSLSGCGGGGGGDGINSIPPPPPPPPPPTPPPPPPPPPAPPGVVTAAAVATAPNAAAFPVASTGGPTMQLQGATSFPLLETVMVVQAGAAGADATANAGGGTLTSDATGDVLDDVLRLVVPGVGLDAAMAAGGGYYCNSTACGYAGTEYVAMQFPDPATSDLSWTTFGTWGTFSQGPTNHFGSYVTGYKTPAASVPTTGSATYSGTTIGSVFYPEMGGLFNGGIGIMQLTGDASLQANFGTGNITGGLTNMLVNGNPWNNVSLAGSITSGVNAFSGTAAVTSVPGGLGTLSAGGAGNFVGMFFGPGAEELGAVWNLFDGTVAATGAIGAKKTP